ncbi:PQQ-binding-like beta-propeller repeat protein [Actinomadura keratinilytica]
MTQPPSQPPNEPPQGGFGAPQDPPPADSAPRPRPSPRPSTRRTAPPEATSPSSRPSPRSSSPATATRRPRPRPRPSPATATRSSRASPRRRPPATATRSSRASRRRAPPATATRASPAAAVRPAAAALRLPAAHHRADERPEFPGRRPEVRPAGHDHHGGRGGHRADRRRRSLVQVLAGQRDHRRWRRAERDRRGQGRLRRGTGRSGGGDEKVPADPNSKVLFQLPAPKVKGDSSYPVKGSWLTSKVFAKPGLSEINGYDLDSGKVTWTTPLSGQHCASSPEVGDGDIAAVVYQNGKPTAENKYPGCDKISAIDLSTGKILWTESVEVSSRPARYDEVSISGSTVAVGGGTDGGAAFDLKSGKELWKPQNGDACEDVGYRGGEALVAVRKCGSYDNPKMEVQLLDASDGTPKWSYKLPAGLDNAKVISVDPVVFGTDSQDITASGVTDVFTLDDKGGLQSRFALEDGKYQHDCGVNKVHDCRQIFAGNGKLFVPTAEHDAKGEEYGRTNEILSFDLKTGKQTGDRFDAGGKYKIYPLRMDGKNVLAYKAPPYDKGGQIVSIDPSGKQTVLVENPATEAVRNVERNFLPEFGEVIYGDGRLFMSSLYVREPSKVTKEPEYLAIAFGTK